MATPDLLLAIDQGSGSSKILLVDGRGDIDRWTTVSVATEYPRPGWVQQSARAITASIRQGVTEVMVDIDPGRIAGVCLSTQRESMVLWNAKDGEPVGPLISWQDQRTTDMCRTLVDKGIGPRVQQATGLPLDPMFSGTRAAWLLDTHDPSRDRARAGEVRLGTVDSWLLAELTGEHLTEPGNASRTQLMNLHDLDWDLEMLGIFGVPAAALPRIVPSAGGFPAVKDLAPLLDGTPVLAVLADSHAALFAHGARSSGQVKATYGTGSSVMGICPVDAAVPPGLCLTVAWDHDGPTYALEGNIRASGSTVAWFARTLGMTPSELADKARSVQGSGGVYLVPAFNGLGAPWWDPNARAVMSGMTLGTELGHLARAAVESIAHQIEDVLSSMVEATGPVDDVFADGGATENQQLMQLQADLSGRRIHSSTVAHLSPLGAAHLGGVTAGFWTREDVAVRSQDRTVHRPTITDVDRQQQRKGWAGALSRSRLAGHVTY